LDYSKDDNIKKRKDSRSTPKKVKNKAITITFRIVVATFIISVFALTGVVLGAYIGIIENATRMSGISVFPSRFTSIVMDKNGDEVFRFTSEENREYVTIDNIPLHLQNAFIAIEDARFFSHNGVDPRGMLRALYVTLFTDDVEGASTITQQLIKNNVLQIPRNTFETKLQEQFLAVRLESQLREQLGSKEAAKKHILEVYLNTIFLANGLHGVQTAANFYFNKDVSELTLSESAVIASITQNPSFYNPVRFPENNRVRQTLVLNRMLEQGFITPAEHHEAINDDVFARVSEFRNIADEESNIHSYFSDHLFEVVRDALIEEGIVSTRIEASNMIFNGGLRIYTTLDQNIQNILEETYLNDSFFPASEFHIEVRYLLTIRNEITGEVSNLERTTSVRNEDAMNNWVDSVREELIGEHHTVLGERIIPVAQPQSAFVVIEQSTGKIRGLVGGRGEKTENRAFNRATHARRQPGSVFKMLASYAPAMDLGLISPSSMLNDVPFEHNGWRPSNWNNRFLGLVSVRDAVKNSMNVVAVTTMRDVGIDTVFDYLLQFGFTTLADGELINGQIFTDRVFSTALGGLTHGVTQLEVTAAYAAIANNGVYIEPTIFTRVYDQEGNLLLEANPESRQVIRDTAAYLLTSTMKDVLISGTGPMARLNTSMPVAGKTGTSQNTRDLTFVGYTPHFTAGVWLGHDSYQTITTTSNAHLTIWAHIMNRIHEGLPIVPFDRPSGVVSASICRDSGLIAIPGLCDITTDLFDSAHLPTATCNIHGTMVIDTLTGLPATADTPFYRRRTVAGPGSSHNQSVDDYSEYNDEPQYENSDNDFSTGDYNDEDITPPVNTSPDANAPVIPPTMADNVPVPSPNVPLPPVEQAPPDVDIAVLPPVQSEPPAQQISPPAPPQPIEEPPAPALPPVPEFDPIPEFTEPPAPIAPPAPPIQESPPAPSAPPALDIVAPNAPPVIE